MITDFRDKIISIDNNYIRRSTLETLQVNLGNICNLHCAHCHINAGPDRKEVMSEEIIGDILRILSGKKGLILDVTGGSPELNPNLQFFIENAKPLVKQVMVRTNMTIFFEKEMEYLPEFYRKNGVKLICSMPCYTKDNVDKQRGKGTFHKIIKALQLLNNLGYGKENDLQIDLVFNPGGAFLPGNQSKLEQDYKKILSEKYEIVFNHLIIMTNAPINRFKFFLKANGKFGEYMKLLVDNFNEAIAGKIMCRYLLSIGWDGILYDCDFNQALGLALRDKDGKIMGLKDIDPDKIEDKEITFGNHCYCCTAGSGSSCTGSLLN